MKKLILLFVVSLLSATSLFAQTDADYISVWQIPVQWYFPNAPLPAANYSRSQAYADTVANFDPMSCDFDVVWAGIPGNGYAIANNVALAASDRGTTDFSGAYKALFDDTNIYILLKTTDDDVTGNETFEISWAPYYKLDFSKNASITKTATCTAIQAAAAPYVRYAAFGAFKALYDKDGYNSVFTITFDNAGVGTITNYNQITNLVDKNTMFVDDHSATASNTKKKICTIPLTALTGAARPQFNPKIWRSLVEGTMKGISFDVMVRDIDKDDALDAKGVATAAAYMWSSTDNNAYMLTTYSGFLGIRSGVTGLKSVNSLSSIFGNVISNVVELNEPTNVEVFNYIGKNILSLKNVNTIDLNSLNKGIYIIRANNESMKFIR